METRDKRLEKYNNPIEVETGHGFAEEGEGVVGGPSIFIIKGLLTPHINNKKNKMNGGDYV